ncbi:3-hydroxybutyrate oligomer hydrolase family protein [Marinobacter fonticola]|uniref:3-hydroxybutyrate oligomer hydrolase family protein n=1 Tax=Marinobacter fonticola TaxID=2603215 RepID=UPI0011E81D11|nr:3-hydroxybutyrate oligomer hydrolase family protein [Marinobacter fonticola]
MHRTYRKLLLCTLIGSLSLGLTACNDDDDDSPDGPDGVTNERPASVSGDVQHARYDGASNDLLTAGLGASGLASGTAPAPADTLNPTAEELRTLAIYNNYRALVDTSAGGGYGNLFGPQVGADGAEGKIPGDEYLAYIRIDDDTEVPVTVMVQIPDSYDPASSCMVTAPSSGSRGIYGAIGTAGEWGLNKGCAVVYTDKGSGTGSFNMETGAAQDIHGRLTTDDSADVQFEADLEAGERATFNTHWPDRFAFKHAHSKTNPEADWGQYVLKSIEFGFYILNERFGEETDEGERLVTVTPDNTLVIASSVSNGGGASVRAAEQDEKGLIDGVAVSEPNVNPTVDTRFTIRQGSGPVITDHSRSLLDYTTAIGVYQGCANLAPGVKDTAPFNAVLNDLAVDENICTVLFNKGLITGADVDARAADAQRILEEDFGVQPEQNLVAPSHFGASVAQSISMTYANAYGRFGVEDRLCELSLAATDGSTGAVTPLAEAAEEVLFSTSNGIPPTGGINQVYDGATGVPTSLKLSTSPSSGVQDHGLDALLCLRGLAQGTDAVNGGVLPSEQAEQAKAIASGIETIRANGNLQGKPTVFVTGRADAILPINHTSRPYFGLNQTVEGSDSSLRYYEVLNAHHLDAFNAFPGFDALYVPLHRYYFQALDLVYAHLKNGDPLPASQVVRTTPRGTGAPALTEANVPPIQAEPAAADRILFEENQVRIPD